MPFTGRHVPSWPHHVSHGSDKKWQQFLLVNDAPLVDFNDTTIHYHKDDVFGIPGVWRCTINFLCFSAKVQTCICCCIGNTAQSITIESNR